MKVKVSSETTDHNYGTGIESDDPDEIIAFLAKCQLITVDSLHRLRTHEFNKVEVTIIIEQVKDGKKMSKPLTDIEVQLTEEDGNAFAIMGRVTRALKQGGRPDLVEPFREEAMSGDYDNLLRTCMKYVDVR